MNYVWKPMENEKLVKLKVRLISFLMPHQEVLQDVLNIVEDLKPTKEGLDKNSEEYRLGAYDALKGLLESLKQKGPSISE